MWVKIQHQMEVLNPIYLTPNMTALTKMIKRLKLWIFISYRNEYVDRMFPFSKRDINESGLRYEPKSN